MNLSTIPTERLEQTADLLRQPNYGKHVEFFHYNQITNPTTQSLDGDVLAGDGITTLRANLSEIETELERRAS